MQAVKPAPKAQQRLKNRTKGPTGDFAKPATKAQQAAKKPTATAKKRCGAQKEPPATR